MKRAVLIVAIYLSGYFAAYILGRNLIKRETGHWTVGDRGFVMVISVGSYLSCAGLGIVYLLTSSFNDEPAKW